MRDALRQHQCPGTGDHVSHAPCAGSETRRTESYTDIMVDAVHSAVTRDADDHHDGTRKTMPATETSAPAVATSSTASPRRMLPNVPPLNVPVPKSSARQHVLQRVQHELHGPE